MSKEFLTVRSRYEVEGIIRSLPTLDTEQVQLDNGVGRIIAERVIAVDPVPHFNRATMDGYAVRSRDVFGASESLPAFLNVVGTVEMGKEPKFSIGQYEAAEIPTGGMLPSGADAVVMVEHTERIDDTVIEVYRPVAPGQNVLGIGEDVAEGHIVFTPGKKLRPQDVGVLAAVGVMSVQVYKQPRVVVISTGDEIVPPDTPSPLPAGVVRDINSYVLDGLIRASGAVIGQKELVCDNLERLIAVCRECLWNHDVVLISGGSSVGTRDYTLEVFQEITDGDILFHGIAIRPGKPTIFGRGHKGYLWGLPGQPASAAMVMVAIVCPFLLHLQGIKAEFPFRYGTIKGVLTKNVPSVHGREDYVPVIISHLNADNTAIAVEPIFGRSGMISILARSQGYIVVPEHVEGLNKGEEVIVYLF